MTFLEEEQEELEKSPEYRRFLKFLLKFQINSLCRKLADVGEESFLVTASVSDGTFSHIGTSKGDDFLGKYNDLEWKFLSFCSSTDILPESFEVTQIEDDEELSASQPADTEYQEDEDNEEDNTDGRQKGEPHASLPVYNSRSTLEVVNKSSLLRHQHGFLGKFPDYQSHEESDFSASNAGMFHRNAIKSEPVDESGDFDVGRSPFAPPHNRVKADPEHMFLTNDVMRPSAGVPSSIEGSTPSMSYNKNPINSGSFVPYPQESSLAFNPGDVQDLAMMGRTENLDLLCNPNNSEKSVSAERECQLCGETFSTPRSLTEHLQLHVDGDGKSCPVCGRTFVQHFKLMEHLRRHSGEYVSICPVCNKGFSQSTNMREHMRVHTGERPYKCTVCEKSFAQNTTLQNHLRTHTMERPYRCTLCNKQFAQCSTLRQHQKRHRY